MLASGDGPGGTAFTALAFAALTSLATTAFGQAKPSDVPSQQIVVDIQAIPERARAQVTTALAKMLDVYSWRTVKIGKDKNRNFEEVVNNEFRYYRSEFPRTTESLIAIIRAANGNPDDRTLVPGTEIRVPGLPQRPMKRGASSARLQEYDLLSGETRLVSASGAVRKEDAREGNGWLFNITQDQRNRFLSALDEDTARSVLGKFVAFVPITQFATIAPPTARMMAEKAPPPAPPAPSAPPRPPSGGSGLPITLQQAMMIEDAAVSISQPAYVQAQTVMASVTPAPAPVVTAPAPAPVPQWQAANVGKYYVLDFFNRKFPGQTCAHGQLVLDQIRATLARHGASALFSKVVPLDIDFYAHPKESAAQMRAFLEKRQPGPVLKSTTEAAIELILKKKPVDELAVPIVYLQNILSSLALSADTALVSSSFWVRIDGFEMFPLDYPRDSRVPLLTAVLDKNSPIEDETSYEPIKSYRDKRRDFGVALIGGLKSPGAYFGMFSRDGDGVTTIEDVAVRGTSGDCKDQVSEGTSFSTPIVGTYLLLAYSRWKDGATISAREARRRLLLSSDVGAAYVSKVASAGRPNLAKMLREPGVWAEKANGELVAVAGARNASYIDFESTDPGVSLRRVFSRSKSGFSGLKVVDNAIYIFTDDEHKWERVNVTHLAFRPDGAGAREVNLDEFVKHYREIVIQ